MNPDLMQAITVLAGRFMAQALIDDGLREDVRALAGAILVATERPPSMTPVEPSPLVAGNEGSGPAEAGLSHRRSNWRR